MGNCETCVPLDQRHNLTLTPHPTDSASPEQLLPESCPEVVREVHGRLGAYELPPGVVKNEEQGEWRR